MRKVIFLCWLGFTVSTSAEVYRWVDSEGKTHYGDRAPQEQRDKATRLKVNVAADGVDPEAERVRQQMRSIEEGRQRERVLAEQNAVKDQQQKAELARRCAALRQEMLNDKNAGAFYRYDDKGEREFWSDEERLAYRERLNNLQQAHCPDLSD